MPTPTPACPLLGDGITDDTLLNIARLLPTGKDLRCLKLTNSRFAAKIIATNCAQRHRRGGSGSARDAVHRGRGGAAVGGGVQRAGARVGVATRA